MHSDVADNLSTVIANRICVEKSSIKSTDTFQQVSIKLKLELRLI